MSKFLTRRTFHACANILSFYNKFQMFIQVARFESRVTPTDDMSIPMATMSNGNGSTMQINTRPDDIRKRIIGCEFFIMTIKQNVTRELVGRNFSHVFIFD